MVRLRKGIVTALGPRRPGLLEVRVLVEGEERLAVAYPDLTGPVAEGDRVTLNTTATALGLGSGGYDFVVAVDGERATDPPPAGHLMKLRYTPLQVKVCAVEEEASPHRAALEACESLAETPVVVGTLHSQLAPACLAIRHFAGERCRIVYVMTDGAALPLAWSETVHRLKSEGLLAAAVTVGCAFGGDLEAVNKFSGLLAAKAAAGADVIVVTMGPGIAGTGTKWGHTGLEQGEWINAVNVLGGRPIAVPRLSFADPRERHRGVSHHFLTALTRVALTPALVPVPTLGGAEGERVRGTLAEAFAGPGCPGHILETVDASFLPALVAERPWAARSMGRGYTEDPARFLAAAAAGRLAAELWRRSVEAKEASCEPAEVCLTPVLCQEGVKEASEEGMTRRETQPAGWLAEETVAREELFRGALIAVRRERVRLPDGREATREIVAHAPAVAILAIDDEDRVLLVRQYRKPLEEPLWEVPAGKLEPGEEPEACARRELAEEAGVTAERLVYVGRIATTPGFCDEVIHLFRAEGLHPVTGVAPDPDEALEAVALPWLEVLAMAERGELWDAKSLCLILREAVRRR